MPSNVFKNRTGSNLNRRKLTIVSQTANEMIVDVERADSVQSGNEGTPITASTLNSFEDRISLAESNSSTAFSNANTALSASNSAETKATTALSNSQQALTTANNAAEIVQTLENQIGDRGAIVRVNNVAQTEINFSSDPQAQLNSKLSTNNLLNLTYPIGSIYMSVNSTNPSTIFGGIWVAWGEGRVPIGIGNNGETNYIDAEMTGGSENSVAQHNHNQNPHSHQVLTNNIWSNNAVGLKDNVTGAGSYTTRGIAGVEQSAGDTGYRNISSSNEQYIQNTTAINISQGSVGGNRQPYITCYMWKRTA